jgi:hypothetical protein
MLVACGNCFYYAIWFRFPAISTCVVVFPVWLLALSTVRTAAGLRLAAVPSLWIALPLIAAVVWFAPGMIGPLLGVWIPICCVWGTGAALTRAESLPLRSSAIVLSLGALVALLIGGTYDYVVAARMPADQRERLRPRWERPPPRAQDTDTGVGMRF